MALSKKPRISPAKERNVGEKKEKKPMTAFLYAMALEGAKSTALQQLLMTTH